VQDTVSAAEQRGAMAPVDLERARACMRLEEPFVGELRCLLRAGDA
jgi:hypothetical protein